jgi:hypothetical protein
MRAADLIDHGPSAVRPGEIARGAALAGPTDRQSLLERSVSMAIMDAKRSHSKTCRLQRQQTTLQ